MAQWSERYLRGVLNSAVAGVHSAAAGERNAQLFRESCGLGELVGAGALGEADVEQVLLDAALSAGLEQREARSTIRSGVKRGKQNPRQPKDPAQAAGPTFRPKIPATENRARPANPPPRGALETVLNSTVWTSEDDGVSAWLKSRGIDPEAVDSRGLARALPPKPGPLPDWCAYWPKAGYRLIIPLWTAGSDFNLSSIRARRVSPGDGPKAVSPTGYQVTGHVFADEFGKFLLRGDTEKLGDSPPQVVVTEGGADFLTWSTAKRTEGPVRAVLGLFSGSWCEDIAKRIPDGSQVVIRTHQDKAGHKYAKQVNESLSGRCSVLRSQP